MLMNEERLARMRRLVKVHDAMREAGDDPICQEMTAIIHSACQGREVGDDDISESHWGSEPAVVFARLVLRHGWTVTKARVVYRDLCIELGAEDQAPDEDKTNGQPNHA